MRQTQQIEKGKTFNTNLIALCVGFAAFMFQFEAFFVQISLPDMQRELAASWDDVTRVITFYLIGAILALMPAGFIGRSIGFGRTFIIGAWIAAIAVSLCGISDALITVWIARFIHGIGIGLMVSCGYTLLPMWLPKNRWGWGFGVISQGAGLGMILGLPLGGAVAHFLDWHWLFLIQIPLAAGIAIFGMMTLPKDPSVGSTAKRSISINSALTSDRTKLLRHGLLSLLLFQALMSGMRYLAPFYMESIQGMNSMQSSLVMLLYALGFLMSARRAGRASDQMGSGRLLRFSYGLATLGCLVFIVDRSAVSVAVTILIFGMSNGLFSAPNNRLLMSEVPPERIQDVSSVLPIALNLGVLSGILAFQSIFQWIVSSIQTMPLIATQLIGLQNIPYTLLYGSSGVVFLLLQLRHRQMRQ